MEKRSTIKNYLLLIAFIGLLFTSMVVYGQNVISGDPTNTFDLESIFVNPAVVPFQHRQVTLGMKVYQLGFFGSEKLGFRTGYFSLALPEILSEFMSMGITGQNFSVPLYDQTNISFLMAKRAFERLSLGIKYNLFTKSYHQKYFDLVIPDDPVFADGTMKFAHSIGAGLILFPWSTLTIAFSCDHLNRPDVSLFRDNYKQPLIYDFGFRYSWGYFSSSMYFNYFQNHWQINWIAESRPSSFSTIRLGFVERAAKLGAQFNLFDGLSIHYSFDYPLYEINQISSGSHQISFMYDLDHLDRIKELQFTKYDDSRFPIFNLPSQFFVEIEHDQLEIIERQIVRSIDEKIPKNALENLTEVELALNDSAINIHQFYRHGKFKNQNLNSLCRAAKYSQKYENWLNENLVFNSRDSIRFIADLNSTLRAENLRNTIINRTQWLDQKIELKNLPNDPVTNRVYPRVLKPKTREQKYFLKPQSVLFDISSLKMHKYRGAWKLVILSCGDQEIKTFAGRGRVPESIAWDWQDDEGKLIKPDIYYYYFQWEDKSRKWRKTQAKMFTVTKISRTLNIDVRSEPEREEDLGRVIEIKLSN